MWVALLPLAVLAYPLSVGPLWWLDRHDLLPFWSMDYIHAVYSPLSWAYGSSEWCQAAFDRYAEFWDSLP